MNVVQNPVDAVENYSSFSSIPVPSPLILGACFHALAWGTMIFRDIFRDRILGQRITDLVPRIEAVEEQHRELLESKEVGYKQETNLDWHDDSGNLKSVRRCGSADDLNVEESVEERFNQKSYVRKTSGTRAPRRSARLREAREM